MHIWRILHKIAYFAPNTEVLKVIFRRKNEKKRLNKTGEDTNLNSKKIEIGLNDTKCSVGLRSRKLDYKGCNQATKQQPTYFSYYSVVLDTIFYMKMTKYVLYFTSKVKVGVLSFFKFAPNTSVDVDRTFSSYYINLF